jgi:hypothetical protein
MENLNFGAEYGRVAVSVYNGQGYGNVWGDTGPSAAVSPFLVYLMVACFYLFGLKTLAAFIVLTLIKHVCLTVSFYLLLQTLHYIKLKLSYVLFSFIWVVFIFFSPSQNFIKISDLWISAFILCIYIYSANKYFLSNGRRGTNLLVLFFLFAPIINPSIALAAFISFILTFVYLLIPRIRFHIPYIKKFQTNNFINDVRISTLIKNLITFTFAFLFFISIWSVRNYNVFGKFIPTKSNMWLEFYLSNIIDTDGQLSFSTSFRGHPLNREDLNEEMKILGEIEWIEKYHQLSLEFLKTDFNKYVNKVLYRLYNAFIFIENDMDAVRIKNDVNFADADKLKLRDNKLVCGNEWICLFYDEFQMKQTLDKIKINNKELIFIDWKSAKLEYKRKKYSIPNITRSISMSLIPLICIVALFFVSIIRKNPVFIISVTLYLFYLLPYILISHQIRYQRSLFVLQVFFIYLLISILLNNLKKLSTK